MRIAWRSPWSCTHKRNVANGELVHRRLAVGAQDDRGGHRLAFQGHGAPARGSNVTCLSRYMKRPIDAGARAGSLTPFVLALPALFSPG